MANLVNISEAVSLALHTMAWLAKRDDRRWTNQQIAGVLDASVHHLAKVMQRLVRGGFVDSAVGPQGGFRLARPAKSIRLLDIYEAIDGPFDEPACPLGKRVCEGQHEQCLLGGLMLSVNTQVRDFLAQTNLAKLAGGMVFIKALQDVDGRS